MKIPEDKYFGQKAEDAWEQAAAQIGIEQGIMVEVGREYRQIPCTHSVPGGGTATYMMPQVKRIFFKLNGHEFETMRELKRALRLKVFL